MERYMEVAKSVTPPSAPAAQVGYPTNGNPQTATPAAEPGEWWFHMITEELRAVIAAAGLTPAHNDLTQLLTALQTLGLQDSSETLKGRIELATTAEVAALTDAVRAITPAGLASVFAKSLVVPGYQKFPGGLIIQWGSATCSGGTTAVTFPIAFPTAILAYGYFNNSTSTSGATTSATSGVVSGFTASSSYATMAGYWIAIGN